eukprot:Clim_evm10s159 gene=Clim_evmTU10s159
MVDLHAITKELLNSQKMTRGTHNIVLKNIEILSQLPRSAAKTPNAKSHRGILAPLAEELVQANEAAEEEAAAISPAVVIEEETAVSVARPGSALSCTKEHGEENAASTRERPLLSCLKEFVTKLSLRLGLDTQANLEKPMEPVSEDHHEHMVKSKDVVTVHDPSGNLAHNNSRIDATASNCHDGQRQSPVPVI